MNGFMATLRSAIVLSGTKEGEATKANLAVETCDSHEEIQLAKRIITNNVCSIGVGDLSNQWAMTKDEKARARLEELMDAVWNMVAQNSDIIEYSKALKDDGRHM
ncbi:hypothetical protein OSTOST_08435 [Ostertagia ostertagi]